MRKPTITNIRQLNGDPEVAVFIKWETRWFRRVARTWFRFTKEYKVSVEFDDGKDIIIVIPVGFITNAASIPLACRGLISAQRLLIAGLIHDYLFTDARYARWLCDMIFRECVMILCGCPKWKGYGAWAMVRLFAHSNYNWAMWNKRNV